MATVAEEITSLVERLSPTEQERVLRFARELAQPATFPHIPLPPGAPGHVVAKVRVSPEVGEALESAHAECERIDVDGWNMVVL